MYYRDATDQERFTKSGVANSELLLIAEAERESLKGQLKTFRAENDQAKFEMCCDMP